MGKSSFNPNNFSSLALTSYNRKTPVRQVKHENTKKATFVRQRSKICDYITFTVISLIVAGVAIFVTYQRMLNGLSSALVNRECNKLVVLLIPNDTTTTTTIKTVFENLDYVVVHDVSENWNVMWSAQESPKLKTKFKPHQLVNHIPSLSLSVHNNDNNNNLLLSDITSRAFELPLAKQELMDYIREHPQKRFIIKDCLVDGVKVDVNNIRLNFDASLVLHELDEKPLLIDGNRFDFGVFFLVTSADPLRIYRYAGDVTARFGIDSAIMEKYFCDEKLTTMPFEMPSLRKFMMIKENSVKNAMEAHLRAMRGENAVTSLYDAIDSAVVKFLSSKLRAIKKPSSQFFQLMRFDFNLDTAMNVRIKNIDSTIDFENNERLLFETLQLLGAANAYDFRSRDCLECPMLSSTIKDILVANSCFNFPCNESCSSVECELCLSCLTQVPDALNHLHRSYREQMRCGVGNMKRIFPRKHHDDDSDSLVNQLSPANRLSVRWFRAKCDAEGGIWC